MPNFTTAFFLLSLFSCKINHAAAHDTAKYKWTMAEMDRILALKDASLSQKSKALYDLASHGLDSSLTELTEQDPHNLPPTVIPPFRAASYSATIKQRKKITSPSPSLPSPSPETVTAIRTSGISPARFSNSATGEPMEFTEEFPAIFGKKL